MPEALSMGAKTAPIAILEAACGYPGSQQAHATVLFIA
jgi:hypothetical protein